MAIKIVLSDKVGIQVRGAINDEAGVAQAFDFRLVCKRLDAAQIQQKVNINSQASLVEFLADVVEDWSGVRDGNDSVLPYSEQNLQALCNIPGVSALAFKTYMAEVGAKEKN
ncbi:MAG: hypothetical protein E6Q78_05275 [Rhodoferax sp.]|nr:MAG: hypothetical protein E6Q78_05275 [Rhodoferax sp.]